MGDEDKTKRRTNAKKKCQYEWIARRTSWDNNTVIRERRQMGLRMVCHIRSWGQDYESWSVIPDVGDKIMSHGLSYQTLGARL